MISPIRMTSRALLLISPLLLAACAGGDVTGADRHAPASVALTVSGASTLTSLGDTARVALRVLDAGGQVVNGAAVRWHATPAGILSVLADGTLRATANGRATIVAEVPRAGTGVRPDGYYINALADSVVVTVSQQPARLLTAVDTAFTSLGAVRPIQTTIADARGNPLLANVPPVVFASSNPAIVSVDAAGKARSVAEGSARVVVQAGTLSGTATFTVQPRRPHTSCMVYAQRTKSAQTCITVQLVMREKGTSP